MTDAEKKVLDTLWARLNGSIKKVEASITNGKKRSLEKRTKGFFKNKIDELTKCWTELNEIHCQISQAAAATEIDHSKLNEKYLDIELKYSDYMADVFDGLEIKTAENNQLQTDAKEANENQVRQHVQLPRINLPIFNGDYDNWRSFRDLFTSVVHINDSIQNVQKLHYLKGCLTGDAEKLLKNIPITNDDYAPAWDKLMRRYENKRILVNTQLKRITSQPNLSKENSQSLRSLVDTTEECMQQLQLLDVDVSTWDTLVIYLMVQKLPVTTIRLWEEELNDVDVLPSLNKFLDFLQTRAKVLECVSSTINSTGLSSHSTKSYHTTNGDQTSICPACGETHYIVKCKNFLEMSITDRRSCISQSQRCFNCFSRNHKVNKCTSKFTCRTCKGKHHTLLHKNEATGEGNSHQDNPNKGGFTSNAQTNSREDQVKNFFNTPKSALLATAQVAVSDRNGRSVKVRCLVDPGSQASFITERAVKRLGLSSDPVSTEISGLNGNPTAWVKRQVRIPMTSCIDVTESVDANLLVVKEIAEALPNKTLHVNRQWTHLEGLQLADPRYWKSSPVDVLIGAEIYTQILQNGVTKGTPGSPTAINTIFGWIVLGGDLTNVQIQSFIGLQTSIDQINYNITRFWESEELLQSPKMTAEEIQCENYFENTHLRLPNGKYQVRLPFINKLPKLGNSRESAFKRFKYLEKKFATNLQLKREYSECIEEYKKLKHMSAIENQNHVSMDYYIPHHAVFKESTTTKLRVVFDASAKSTNGKSLNEQLLTGPTLQPKLFSTLLKWRKYKIALTGDIEKMYRMVEVHPDDRRFQKIIWKDSTSDYYQDYELNTLTFGTTSAPYLAIKTLQQLSIDEGKNFPLAAKAAFENFYVDDLLTGGDSIEETINIRNQCIHMLKTGHFKLRKWASNKLEVLAGLPNEDIELKDSLEFKDDIAIKTLGIKWIPNSDVFTFTTKLKGKTGEICTKRQVLSEIASLYDPLGWIAPVVITAKIIMQELWISGCAWDDKITPSLNTRWKSFKDDLANLEKIKIPRWSGYTTSARNIQIHGFCDASIQAYGAVVYLRIEDKDTITSHMLTAKTKVAPIKPTTLPRLELNGALLLAKLINNTIKDMQFDTPTIIAWSDSTIALQWIKGHPNKWKTYVANRVAEIQELIKPECWRHVPSEFNPADIASRGAEAAKISQHTLWWKGPSWLTKSCYHWPTTKKVETNFNLEAKKEHILKTFVIHVDQDLFLRYSSFQKLKRVIATMQRFVFNCKNKIDRVAGELTIKELDMAATIIFKQIQRIYFPQEYKKLSQNTEINSKSKLLSLRPFMDSTGVIRVGGRLEHANVSYNQKHPVILPSNHHITTILINKIHLDTLHGGTNLVLNTSRMQYWIVNAKQTIAKQINRCPVCIRYRKRARQQLMGDLPTVRITESRPFENVGIDYAGPIAIKTSTHRNAKVYKGYFCIFVCMATKAVHLEVVSSLNTEAFLAALKRFVARRGLCKNIYSDCGSNFKGAETILDKELKETITQAAAEASQIVLNHNSILWHFNPPGGPHFGGLWEAGVKSVKYHLRRIIGKATYTFEELTTLITQIEGILNSRPLCQIGNSIEDLEVLTPGHFLIGQPLICIPETNITHKEINLQTRWKRIQHMSQQFWDKWSKDYLNQLQNRPKWLKPHSNIKENDIVLIKDENLTAASWPLGRIVKVFPGKDGVVRVVEVRTATNTYRRPITKICPLATDPIQNEITHDASINND